MLSFQAAAPLRTSGPHDPRAQKRTEQTPSRSRFPARIESGRNGSRDSPVLRDRGTVASALRPTRNHPAPETVYETMTSLEHGKGSG
jgi:hypothetical protein